MGVPAFFRWLSRKYASVIIDCNENKQVDPDTGKNIYEDATLPNPNGVEFDNLYLDMNGIIHPCTHPEDKPAPKNEDEMMVAIFDCIDRLFGIVRPRKVLYMAIDGVAPRAKMNQQRSRRFRAAKETTEKRMEIARIREELLTRGCKLPPEKEKGEHFDSNCITPGTPFMDRLSKCLHYYVHDRQNNNPAWKGIKVILSDANVPGEGEHKIMDYIRKQRAQPDHDPNTQHVLCGADADLIMLGLATHEPNFTIIREEFLPNKPRPCDICNQFGHEMDKCLGLSAVGSSGANFKPDVAIGAEVKFIFVRLSVLREYLKQTLEMPNLPFEYDFERTLDDWVFMCFFVGNDFLPHLPSLEIREGAVDRLVELYKKCVYKTKGYLTDSGDVNLDRVQLIMTDLGNAEDQIFKSRQRREQQFKAREKQRQRQDHSALDQSVFGPTAVGGGRNGQPSSIANYKQEAAALRTGQKRPNEDTKDEEEDNDEVRLWEDGFKSRYYESKFDVAPENHSFRYAVALQYVRGLCWVLKYYYQGCASWNWYFPYHYAPFASDFVNIQGLSTAFEKGTKPFNPLEQLMGVFPAASSSHVPEPWAELMSSPDSPIIDFYPEDFKIDLNGKKFAWQGVALLPFVDEKRLFKALVPYYTQLTGAEVKRNKQGHNFLYISNSSPHYKKVKKITESTDSEDQCNAISFNGMRGTILRSDIDTAINGCLPSPIAGLPDITGNTIVTTFFIDPEYDDDYIFEAKRLPDAVDPPQVLPSEGRKTGPVIGFNSHQTRAYVAPGGHRMLNAGIRNGQGDRGQQGYNQGGGGGGYGQGQGQGYQNNSRNYNYNYNNNYNQQHQGRGGGYQSQGQGSYQNRQQYGGGQQQQYQNQRYTQDGGQQQQQGQRSYNNYNGQQRNYQQGGGGNRQQQQQQIQNYRRF
ncbi:5'-3' exoribonuclease 2 homolog [Drosophila miranda]|uniref:5'-3' exoribonuclease 2 homolog n=1 Tax=Drosophila miranda TaxID=7229 RepID=UPI0007E89546|nr:5'-3' exoribonuclease 2 homolog [Drosophila miranda]